MAAPHTVTRHRAMELFFLLRRSSPLDCEAVLARGEGGLPGFLRKVLGQPGLEVKLSLVAGDKAVAWCRCLRAVLES